YFMVVFMLNEIILSPMWSAFTEAYTKQDFNWIKKILKYLNFASWIYAIGIVLMLVFSDFIYRFWLGDDIQIPFSLSISIAIYFILRLFLAPYTRFINGTGKILFSLYLNVLNIFVFLI